jgi:hypothetical protein
MANEAALNFITNKITGLEIIKQELSRMFLNTLDLDQADDIRREITRLNQMLFTLESMRNSLAATANEVPPPTPARIEELTNALRRLDSFVSGDQNVQAVLTFLTQLADVIHSVSST